MSKVLVLGGSGFLGSHVADELTRQGFQVIIFDKTPSKYLQSNQEMVVGDILNQEQLVSAVKGVDYIYNFAGLADIDEAQEKPVDTANLNVMGNINALEAARINNVKRYIFASTVYVFAKTGSFYRASKQACESFIEAYHQRYHLDYTILRYGSLYGRRADQRNGIYRLLKQALSGDKIVYSGHPNAMREYIHVQDAARLSAFILKDEYKNKPIVLTGHEKFSIDNMFTMIKEILNINIPVEYKEGAHHYNITPYTYQPTIGHKLVLNDYVDIGQGILDCLQELSQEKNHQTDEKVEI